MTRTSMLTQLPFYTADSTTWLVGLQYGEVNYWNGSKMSRLKKDKWKGSMLDSLCETYNLDKDKMLEEDVEELIKVNLYAFIDAENYIQHRLKSQMYWLKPSEVKRTNLDDVKYPSLEWLTTPEKQSDWRDYAQNMNITQEDKELALDCIFDVTCIMNFDSVKYADIVGSVYTTEHLKELHDQWINRIVGSDEEILTDLQKFYTEVLMGENNKLLVLGTNFDRMVKDRDSYIEEEEYILEDVSDIELSNTLSKFLPLPKEGESAPEIDELDDEIFRAHEIIPVRDAKGRFIKGQRYRPAPKKMYSKKYPKCLVIPALWLRSVQSIKQVMYVLITRCLIGMILETWVILFKQLKAS